VSATDSRKRVLAPAALGLALAVLCHPDVASAAVAFLGETPRRALPLDHLGALARNHLALAGLGLALVGIGGAGLGILATRPGATRLRPAIDTLAAFAQAVPPVVAVALALPVLSFGGPPTLLAMLLYGLMPALRGTVAALEAVPADAREAAAALGLTHLQILVKVELPLAAPGLLDTLRTALVLAVATAALGALAGAPTLGTPVVAGLQNQNLVPMIQGAAATAALAFLCEALLLAAAALAARLARS